ncbi:putative aryl-alcohol dehydrogenase aad14 [Marasmius tenuissimus]|uniref:Aryl-alcohol dehydrogenase aad14 n=1 Tax=Marasmius tenuissimus TaxID=585030 RepID=A0ABR3A074_9AGAR
MPSWLVAKANEYAKFNRKTQFSVYQGEWSIMRRHAFERDFIPLAREYGMALAPWGVLVQGKIRTDAEEQQRRDGRGRTQTLGRLGAKT